MDINQPLRQYILHIRSKDVTRTGVLNSHLFVELAEPIRIDAIHEEIHQNLLSVEIPYSFYNISPDVNNNTIQYTIGGVVTIYTLPSLMYDITKLIDVITASTFPFTATYDQYTMKISLLNTSGSIVVLNWSESLSFKVLGFSNLLDVSVAIGATTISDNIIDLATVHSLQLKSNTSSTMIFSTRAGFSQTIQKISVDVNSGSIIYLNDNDSRQSTILHSNIDMMDLRITDQNDNLINFNNINYELSIGFFIYPINKIQLPKIIETKSRLSKSVDINRIPPVIENLKIVDNDINHISDIEHQNVVKKNNRILLDELIDRMSK